MQLAVATVLVSFASAAFAADVQPTDNSPSKPWTLLIYGGVDSSAEAHILPHLQSLGALSSKGQAGQILLLMDRTPGHSDDDQILGENFEDTRLFQLNGGTWNRVAGGAAFPEITQDSTYEANSGHADTLGKFIDFGKKFAPAERYALIVFGHGDCRSVCPDLTSPNAERDEHDDPLYVAELTHHLTAAQSVDLIWFDVCSFAAIENAYQLRPRGGAFSTQAMLATPPVSTPAPMSAILEQAGILGEHSDGDKQPADGVAFGTVAVDVTARHLAKASPLASFSEAWSCFDLTAADDVKRAVDRLAVVLADGEHKQLAERIRGSGKKRPTLNYMSTVLAKDVERAWVAAPHFDLYDLARRLDDDSATAPEVKSPARDVMHSVDRLVAASYGGRRYRNFEPGKHGVYIVFPDGDASWRDKPQWARFGWYHPDDRQSHRYSFGNYAWCADGATASNGVVENWFELMDRWFDTDNATGGLNGYRW